MYVEHWGPVSNTASGQRNRIDKMIKVTISTSPNKRMTGSELRRVMSLAGLTVHQLSKRLKAGWNRRRIERLMKAGWFDLHPVEMEELLTALGASSL